MVNSDRDRAYKRLRAAAHRLLCDTYELPSGRVAVKSGKLNALSRALDIADELERTKDDSEDYEPNH